MNPALYPGPGDLMPQFAGHPHDPRNDSDDGDDTTADLIAEVRGFIVAAELAAMHGDMDKAREALIEARMSIEGALS